MATTRTCFVMKEVPKARLLPRQERFFAGLLGRRLLCRNLVK